MFVVTSNVVLRVCAVQHKTCFLGRCLSLYTTEGFASYLMRRAYGPYVSWVWSVYKCSQIVAVPFFTRLVVNSSTYLKRNVHSRTATPGFGREWLNLFAKLTCFHPHRCAHRIQLVHSVRQRRTSIVAQPTRQILPESCAAQCWVNDQPQHYLLQKSTGSGRSPEE